MSVYASLDGADGDLLATNRGYFDLTRWIDGLETKAATELVHLRTYGWCQNLPALEKQLSTALADKPPEGKDVRHTADVLLSVVKGRHAAEVLTVNDGTSPVKQE